MDNLNFTGIALRGVRHWFVAMLLTAFVGSLTLVYVLSLKDIYTTQSKLILQSASSGLGSLASLASLAGVDVSSASSKSGDASLYVEDLLKSNDFAEAVLNHAWKASKDVKDTSKAFTLREFWKTKSDTSHPNWEVSERNGLIQRLTGGKYITASKDRKTGVVTLTTEFEDPRLSYDLNLFLIQELNNTLVNRLNSKARANRKFLEARVSEVKADLSKSEDDLRRFRQGNRLRMDPEYQIEEGRIQRDLQINQEIYLQLVKQFEMAKLDEAKNVPTVDIVDSPLLPVRKTRPHRSMLLLGGLFVGLVLGIFGSGLFDFYREDKKRFWAILLARPDAT
jgi:uncharacterized protein involved in exopolysaccharide biosynthesis